MILLDDIIKVYTKKGHVIFKDDSKPYNLNYGGIRDLGGQWNDIFFIFWFYNGLVNMVQWKGTADPGAFYLKDPMNVKGSAIIPDGQHLGLFGEGMHKGRYWALTPCRELAVWRIPEGWTYADIDKLSNLELDTGWHGTNSHRAHDEVEVMKIGKYSAGCQVTLNPDEYDVAVEIWKKGFEYWGPKLSFTIVNINDFS